MKKYTFIAAVLFTVLFVATSCGSPYKKRKACRGNGSWYGNRNLGAIDQKAPTNDVYRMTASID